MDTGFLSGVLRAYSVLIWEIPFGLYSLPDVLAVCVVKQTLICCFEMTFSWQILHILLILYHNGGYAVCLEMFVLEMMLYQICSSLSLCSYTFSKHLAPSVPNMAIKKIKKQHTLSLTEIKYTDNL